MTPPVIGILGILLLFFLMFVLGTPVAFAMIISGFWGYFFILDINAACSMLGTELWETLSSYGLTVIPLFVFMGQAAFRSGISKKLYDAAYAWFGTVKGGLAMSTIISCSAFSAICGSNSATAATMMSVVMPEMEKYKYNPILSTGSIACGSTLGVVIPPSVVLIVIGLSTGLSISKLFYGSIMAGLIVTLLFLVTIYILCIIYPSWAPKAASTSFSEKMRTLPGIIDMLILFTVVMAGLYFGVFTPVEAGAVGSAGAVILGIIRKSFSLKAFYASVADTLKISCMVISIVAGAVIFGKFLALTRIPFDVASWVSSLPLSNSLIIVTILLVCAIGGTFMDSLALLLIAIPVFYPVALSMGYDPIWFSIILTVVTTLGAVTPPVGATAYVVAGMSPHISLKDIFKGITFFIPAYMICIAILMIFPKIITVLPNLVH